MELEIIFIRNNYTKKLEEFYGCNIEKIEKNITPLFISENLHLLKTDLVCGVTRSYNEVDYNLMLEVQAMGLLKRQIYLIFKVIMIYLRI